MPIALRSALLAVLLAVPCLAQSPLEKAVPPTNSVPPDPLKVALHLSRTGQFETALEHYQQYLQSQPKSAEAFAGVTRAYLRMGKIDEAQQSVSKALDVTPSPLLHVALGEVYFRQGRIGEAEKEFVGVINGGGPPDARAYLGLARIRRSIAMYHSSKMLIDKAHALDPEDPDIQKFWIDTLSREDHIKYLEQYLAGDTDDDKRHLEDTRHYLDYLKARAIGPEHHCHLETKVDSTETPLVPLLLDPRHIRYYGVEVALNGHKATLVLDTGASGLLIDRRVAEKAGVSKISDLPVKGIGDKGDQSAYVGYAESIKIGGLEFRDCPVQVLEKRSVMGDDGLIGADVFGDFLIDLDFPDRKLKLQPLPQPPNTPAHKVGLQTDSSASDQPEGSDKNGSADKRKDPEIEFQDRYIAPEMASYSRVFQFGHHVLVPTIIGNTPMKLFLLDTGAFNNVISNTAAGEVTKVHGDSDTIIKGLSGSVNKVYSADKLTIHFGRLRQENQDMVAWDLTNISEDDGTEISGFLGFAMLQLLDIKIDYRDGLIDFQYDAEKHR